jgi:signal peptidase I
MNAELEMAKPGSISELRPVVIQPQPNAANPILVLLRHQLTQSFALAALAILCYFGISRYLVQSVRVVGVSMVPTLADSQQYLLNRWVYHFREPQTSEIVVLRDPSDQGFSVKRIIAREGDSVYLKDGYVFINGRKLLESYLPERTPTYAFGRFKDQLIMCGKDQYFVLGDNRMNSCDSRTYGPIPRESILGMIVR